MECFLFAFVYNILFASSFYLFSLAIGGEKNENKMQTISIERCQVKNEKRKEEQQEKNVSITKKRLTVYVQQSLFTFKNNTFVSRGARCTDE